MPTKTKTGDNLVPLFRAAQAALRTGEDVRRPEAPAQVVEPDEYPVVRPKDVLPHPKDLACMVAWDTEASGLYVDDGARVAIVSVAFCTKDDPDEVKAFAFPFDQGRAADKGFEYKRDKRGTLVLDNRLLDREKGPTLVKWDGVHVPRGYRAIENRYGRFLQVDTDAWERDVNLAESDWHDMMRWLRLAGEYVGLDAHNAKYDMHVTKAGTRHWPGVSFEPYIAWDSMLACKELWPLESVALKNTATRLWGAEQGEEAEELRVALTMQKVLYGLTSDDGPRYDLLPWDLSGPYATQDAALTLRLTKLQTDMFEDGYALWSSYDRAHDQMRACWRMEDRGFGPFDMERADAVARAIEARIAQLENALPFDPPTDYRAKEYFFDDLGMRPWKGAEEGREIEYYMNKQGGRSKKILKQGSLSVDVAKRMASQQVPFAAEFAELLRLRTANRMNYRGYYNLASKQDHRIRTSYKQLFVRSGRMSVERFQAQAIPRRDSVKITELPGFGPVPHPRDLFLTPEGRTRVTMDLSQAELRVAFKFSGCKRGIEQILEGRDIHGEMATQIFGVQPGEDEFSHFRYISKRGVFGGIFMVGPKTFRETIWNLAQLWLPYEVAKKTVYGFRELYPEIEQAYNASQEYVMSNGYVELVDGTKSWFGPRDYDNTAWNRRVQGSLALFNAHWLVECERRTEQWDALVLSVHDSVTLDLPAEVAERVVAEIQEWTSAEFERWFGIPGGTDCDWSY